MKLIYIISEIHDRSFWKKTLQISATRPIRPDKKPFLSQSTLTLPWLEMTTLPLIQLIPQQLLQHLLTGQHGDLVPLTVVLVQCELDRGRAIPNTVRVPSKRAKRAL